MSPAVINDVMVSDVAAERIGFNDLLRSLCPYCVWTWRRWRAARAQDAAREKDLWVSSRHRRSHSHIKGEMFQQRLLMSIIIVYGSVLKTDLENGLRMMMEKM